MCAGVGVYVYALWVLAWAVVWFGDFPAAHSVVFEFGGVTMASNVVVFEGKSCPTCRHSVSGAGTANVNHPGKGAVHIPGFSWSPFPSDVDSSAKSVPCRCGLAAHTA